jgi:hypothetical protein
MSHIPEKLSENPKIDLPNFVKGCDKIMRTLTRIHEAASPDKKILLIAPGEGPSKVIEFLERAYISKKSNIKIISFPLSNMHNKWFTVRTQKYIKSKLPWRLKNKHIVIIDYLATGCTVGAILSYLERSRKLDMKLANDELMKNLYPNNIFDSPKPSIEPKHILNINKYFEGDLNYIIDAQKYHTRRYPYYDTDSKTRPEKIETDRFVRFIEQAYQVHLNTC